MLGGRLTLLVVSFTAALVVAAAAWASGTDKEPRHYTAADQAIARSIVLTQSDVGSAWKGGAKKVDTSAPPTCPNFDPKQSDLLVTGDAESMFSDDAAGVQYDSEAQVLQTAQMVQLDWQRSIPQPGLLPCLRTILAKSLPANERIVSVTRVEDPEAGDVQRRDSRRHRRAQQDRAERRAGAARRGAGRPQPHGDHAEHRGAVRSPRSRSSSPRSAWRSCSSLALPPRPD